MKNKRRIRIIAALLTLVIASGASGVFADTGFYGGSDSSTGGGSASHYNGWNWTRNVLAWFRYDFADYGTPLGSNLTVPFDPTFNPTSVGPSGAKNAIIPKDCRTYSKSFYISGYVLFEDKSDNKYWPRNDGYWTQANGNGSKSAYTGLYLGLVREGSGNYVSQGGELTRADTPTGVSSISVVTYGEAEAAFNEMRDKGIIPSTQSQSFDGYTWFCGGELANKDSERYYDGHAKIRIKATDKEGAHDVNAQDTNKEITLKGSAETITVNYRGYGYASAASRAITAGYDPYEGTKFSLYTKLDGSISASRADIEGSTSNNFDSFPVPDTNDGSFQLSHNQSKKICTENVYQKHYKNGWTNDTGTASACYTVKYVDDIKVELGSVSQVSVSIDGGDTYDAFSIEPATKSQLSSKNFGSELSGVGLGLASQTMPETIDENNVPAGNVSVMAMNKITKEKIVTGNDMDLALRDITITNPMGVSSCGALSGNFVDCYKSTSGWDAGMLYPGQTRSFTAQTKHPAEISSSAVTNPAQESSTATVKLTAAPLQCKDFGNKEVGVNNPVNYGRMAFVKNGGIVVRGDGSAIEAGDLADGTWKASDVYWRKDNDADPIQLIYYGCMGYQIKLDSEGVKEETEQVGYSLNNSNTVIDSLLYSGMENKHKLKDKAIMALEYGRSAQRLKNGYQFQEGTLSRGVVSAALKTGFIGESVNNTYTWDNGTLGHNEASIAIKTPYNYWVNFEDNANSKVEVGGDDILSLGNTPEYNIKIGGSERVNSQVSQTEYKTAYMKKTYVSYAKIYVNSNLTRDELANINSAAPVDGNFANNNIEQLIRDKLGSRWEYEPGTSVPTTTHTNNYPTKVPAINGSFNEISEAAVGKKICLAVAVYPSDSHNTGDGSPITDSDQSAALSGYEESNGKTKFYISCKTVGKAPSISVEGGSLSAGGQVTGRYSRYQNQIFGSWVEYGLLSDESKEFGSGASLAYARLTTNMNANRMDGDGLAEGGFANPQTIGNVNGGSGSPSEASALLTHGSESSSSPAWAFAGNIKAKYINNDSVNDSRVVVYKASDGKSLGDAVGELANPNKLVIYYVPYGGSDLTISQDIVNNSSNSLLIIYAERNINITNNVRRLDAFLIADKRAYAAPGNTDTTAVIDTCSATESGDSTVEVNGKNYKLNQNDSGVQGIGYHNLLKGCYNQLVINGAVMTNEIELDRTYGGGSLDQAGDDDITLSPDTLTVRAEVFNYDPRINYWSYELAKKETTYDSSYARELTPRL